MNLSAAADTLRASEHPQAEEFVRRYVLDRPTEREIPGPLWQGRACLTSRDARIAKTHYASNAWRAPIERPRPRSPRGAERASTIGASRSRSASRSANRTKVTFTRCRRRPCGLALRNIPEHYTHGLERIELSPARVRDRLSLRLVPHPREGDHPLLAAHGLGIWRSSAPSRIPSGSTSPRSSGIPGAEPP